MSNAGFDYDDSDWPVVRIGSPKTVADDATFERHIQRLTAYLERRKPLVFVIELHDATSLSVEQRDRIRRHEAERRDLIARYQRGMAIVVRSSFQRAMIKAVFWLIESPSPTQAFATIEAAMSWARALLGQQPPSVVRSQSAHH